MKQNKIYWLIIAVLVLLLILQQQCRRCPESPEPSSDTVTLIEYDSFPVVRTLPVPVPYYRDTGSILWQYKDVDTATILREFFTVNYYRDTLKDDTSALIVLDDAVTQNKLGERVLFYQNRRPLAVTTIINQVGDIPRNKVFIGPVIGRSLNDPTIGGSILLVGKKKFAYSYTYDILNKDHYLGIYYKISLKTRQ